MNEQKESHDKSRCWPKVGSIAACIAVLISAFSLFVSGRSCSISNEAKDQSGRFGVINAEVQWNSLLDEFEEIDTQLLEWEEGKGYKRELQAPASLDELKKILSEIKPPDEIRQAYLKRHRKYESLQNMSEQYKPFADRFASLGFKLPSPPKLPSASMSGVSTSGVSRQ